MNSIPRTWKLYFFCINPYIFYKQLELYFSVSKLNFYHSKAQPRNACVACGTLLCATTKKVWLLDRQTDRRRTKWSLCAAMLRRRHNKQPHKHTLFLNSISISLSTKAQPIKQLKLRFYLSKDRPTLFLNSISIWSKLSRRRASSSSRLCLKTLLLDAGICCGHSNASKKNCIWRIISQHLIRTAYICFVFNNIVARFCYNIVVRSF